MSIPVTYKRFTAILTIMLAVCISSLSGTAFAFSNNNVMDDGVFDNVNSMDASAIDNFLNSQPNSCISSNNGFSAIDPTGYNPTDSYTYGGNVTAGKIIYDAAQAYGINPQVILTTLQKEQSLVKGDAGCATNRYVKAAGYGCPDSGGSNTYTGLNLYTKNGVTYTDATGVCVNTAAKAGFSQQVIRAAWLLRYSEQRAEGNIDWAVIKGNWNNSDDLNASYSGYMTQGCFKRSRYESTCTNYDGYTTIDSTSVHIDNGATAALYRYTPHFSGNQNFVTIFNNWFGSQFASYKWSTSGYQVYDSTESYQVDPGKLSPGQTYIVKLAATNIGTATWFKNAYNHVMLGPTSPQGRSSNLCNASWLSCNRPAGLMEASVAPGGVGNFKFTIQAPYAAGEYREDFKPLAEMFAWMNDTYGETLGIKVQSPGSYSWSTSGYKIYDEANVQQDPGRLQPGQKYAATLTAINTGTATWTNTGPTPINLGTANGQGHNSAICSSSWSTCGRPARLTESSVAPGSAGHFSFSFNAPYRPGEYREDFKPLAEMAAWMNDSEGETLGVKVNNPGSYSWSNNGYKVYDQTGTTQQDPGRLQPNQKYLVTLSAQNTGSATWTNTGPTPINLGTANQEGRSSNLCDAATWSGCNRPTRLQEASVSPGQSGHFSFLIQTPASSGTYREYFKPLAEMYSWMNDTSEPLGIIVQ